VKAPKVSCEIPVSWGGFFFLGGVAGVLFGGDSVSNYVSKRRSTFFRLRFVTGLGFGVVGWGKCCGHENAFGDPGSVCGRLVGDFVDSGEVGTA